MLKPILSPVNPGSEAADIANLQDALLFLYERGQFITRTPPDQPAAEELAALIEILRIERAQPVYGEATRQLVLFFQLQSGLGDNYRGLVNDLTLTRLNELLQSLGAFQQEAITYRVYGTVLDERHAPAPGIRVVAYDRDVTRETALGEALTDGEGRYNISFAENTFRKTAAEKGGPDLVVRAFDEKGAEIGRSDLKANAGRETELPVQLNRERFVVQGVVRRADGKPEAGLLVKAVDHDLRREENLGETFTGADGTYSIVYTNRQFTRAEKDNADLEVRVYGADKNLLAASDIYFNAAPDLVVDLTLPAAEPLSEWEQIRQLVLPLLANQGKKGAALPPAELTDKDINFIVRDTGLEREQVRLWVLAWQTAGAVQLLRSDDHSQEAMLFFGWFREGQPQVFKELVRLSTETLMNALGNAVRQRYIPDHDEAFQKQLGQTLDDRRIEEVLKPAGEGEPASLGDVLGTMEAEWLTPEKQTQIAAALQNTSVESEDFMSSMKKVLPRKLERLALRRTLRLGALTLQHPELVKALQPIAETSGDDSLRSLASLPPDQWLDLAYAHGTAPGAYPDPEAYALHLEEKVEEQEPTATLAYKLRTHPYFTRSSEYKALIPTLEKRRDFNIRTGDVALLPGLKKEEKAVLHRLQQLKRMGARWDEAAILLEHGVDSFAPVVDMGPEQFQLEFQDQLNIPRLQSIYAKASAIYAASIGLLGYLQPMLHGVTPAVMTSYKDDPKARAIIEKEPTLRNLFGPLETCACAPCLSVLSPSAYLVDLLKFVDGNISASLKLRELRPDLYDLDLSCENSEVKLPHIDLAIEILENKVALPKRIPLSVGVSVLDELKKQPIEGAIREALQETASEPLGTLTAVKDEWSRRPLILFPGRSWWVVTDRYRRWVLEAQEAYFGLEGSLFGNLDADHQNMADIIRAMDAGQIHPGIDSELRRSLIEHYQPGTFFSIESISVKTEEQGKRWKIDYTLKGVIKVEVEAGTVTIENKKLHRQYSSQAMTATEQSLASGKAGGILTAWLPKNRHGAVVVQSTGAGYQYRETYQATIVYRPASLTITGLTYQSTKTDADLFSQPQHRNPLAYIILNGNGALYPWSLPYDAYLHETRELLSRIKLTRLSLLQAMTPYTKRPSQYSLALERLGLSDGEAKRITEPLANLWESWGLRPGENSKYAVFDTYSDTFLEEKPEKLLSTVSILMQQAGLGFEEVQEVLACSFVNPGNKIIIKASLACDPTQLFIENISPVFLETLQKFLRLRKALKWEFKLLDHALTSLKIAPNRLDTAALQNLACLLQLSERLSLPIKKLLDWLEQPATSTKVLRNALSLTADEYESARIVLQHMPEPFTSTAALAAFVEEIDFVRKHNQSWGEMAYALCHDGPDLGRLEFDANRTIRLIREIRLQIDFQQWNQFRNLVPSPPRNDRERWQRWGLTPKEGSAEKWSVADPLDPTRRLQGKPLDLLKRPDVLARQSQLGEDQLIALLSAPFVETDEKQRPVLPPGKTSLMGLKRKHLDRLEVVLSLIPPARLPVADFIEKAADFSELTGQLITQDADSSVAFLIGLITADLIGKTSNRLGIELQVEPTVVEEWLSNRLTVEGQSAAKQAFFAILLKDPAFEPDRENVAAAHPYLILLHKLVLLNRCWQASASEWALLHPTSTREAFAGLKPDRLSPKKNGSAGLYTAWKQSTRLFTLAHLGVGVVPILEVYLTAVKEHPGSPYAGLDHLAVAFRLQPEPGSGTGLDTAKILADQLGLEVPDGGQRLDPLWLADLFELLGLAQKLALSGEELIALAVDQPDDQTLTVARKALKERFDDESAKNSLQEVANSLREARRDRLVDYLIWRDRKRNADALYEQFLIDPQISSCLKTTRVLQATAAVQLFVHRCLMNLEAGILPEFINRNRWEWMRNYRVWEANRKVFLYPENWLFPELRDDKTETFRTFESALMQSEPSKENASSALSGYLEALVDISQIEILGLYVDGEERNIENPNRKVIDRTIYLIGRSIGKPNIFYCRKADHYIELGIKWSGWERIDLDISSDHIIPFALNGQLFIAWPSISRTENSTNSSQVYMQWSRKLSTGWDKIYISEKENIVNGFPELDPSWTMQFILEPVYEADGEVYVDVYSADELIISTGMARSSLEVKKTYTSPYKTSIDWGLTFNLQIYTQYIDSGSVIEFKGKECLITINGLKQITDRYGNIHYEHIPGESVGPWDIQSFPRGEMAIYPASQYFLTSIKIICGDDEYTEVLEMTDIDNGDKYSVNLKVFFLKKKSATKEGDSFKMSLKGHYIFDGKTWQWNTLHQSGQNSLSKSGFIPFQNGEVELIPSSTGYPPLLPSSIADQRMLIKLAAGNILISSEETVYIKEGDIQLLLNNGNGTDKTAYLFGYPEPNQQLIDSKKGIEKVFHLDIQIPPCNRQFYLSQMSSYFSSSLPQNLIRDNIQFDRTQPNSLYNWEVFYHLPIAVSYFLSRQHRFEDARRWFHFVFDPTTNEPVTEGAERVRFWKFLPFRHQEQPDSILTILEMLPNPKTEGLVRDNLQGQIDAWLDDPFNPFAIARLRPAAFEWFTVIAYVNNLIDWGDQLFRRDTRESINEATLLYVLAAKILGRKPEKIKAPKNSNQPVHSYRSLEGKWDGFSNAWLSLADSPFLKAIEEWYQWLAQHGINPKDAQDKLEQLYQLSSIGSLYFCVPANEKLPEIWGKVEDRLFNIRHCRNIDGIQRELSLYDDPIDVEAALRLKAAGLKLEDVLQDRFAPAPHYRFQILLQKAYEFCNEVKGLGAALLSALEKKEAEHLTLLRSKQEIDMLRLVESIKKEQIEEAEANLNALEKTRNNTLDRFIYLQRQLGKNEIQYDPERAPIVEQGMITSVQQSGMPNDFRGLALIQSEIDQIWRLQDGHWFSVLAGASKASSGVFHMLAANPFNVPWAQAVGHGLSAIGDGLGAIATNASFWEKRAGLIAGWQRRRDEWVQQSKMAAEEIRQIDKQIIALEIRKKIAKKDLDNHRKQIEFAQNVDDYMRRLKFTGESLYLWMESQLANLYFGAYQMAFELAKRAERAFQLEIGDESKRFITYGNWDKLRAGLLSGERLSQELRRLELAFLDQNRREYEITKHVSILQINPVALVQLRTTGKCTVSLPEALFDIDCPGHYLRRIKSVALSIPCVAGPYTSVNCTLTLLKSAVRKNAGLKDGNYRLDNGQEDDRFIHQYGAIQSIVTSSAQNDSGLFETNLRDERYLPFEGAGVISEWQLELPPTELQQFNYDTIADVILHLRYTAREGGSSLSDKAIQYLTSNPSTNKDRLFSIRHEFPVAWTKFRTGTETRLALQFDTTHFPFWMKTDVKSISDIVILVKRPESQDSTPPGLSLKTKDKKGKEQEKIIDFTNTDNRFKGIWVGTLEAISDLKIGEPYIFNFADNKFEDLWMIVTRGDKGS